MPGCATLRVKCITHLQSVDTNVITMGEAVTLEVGL